MYKPNKIPETLTLNLVIDAPYFATAWPESQMQNRNAAVGFIRDEVLGAMVRQARKVLHPMTKSPEQQRIGARKIITFFSASFLSIKCEYRNDGMLHLALTVRVLPSGFLPETPTGEFDARAFVLDRYLKPLQWFCADQHIASRRETNEHYAHWLCGVFSQLTDAFGTMRGSEAARFSSSKSSFTFDVQGNTVNDPLRNPPRES